MRIVHQRPLPADVAIAVATQKRCHAGGIDPFDFVACFLDVDCYTEPYRKSRQSGIGRVKNQDSMARDPRHFADSAFRVRQMVQPIVDLDNIEAAVGKG